MEGSEWVPKKLPVAVRKELLQNKRESEAQVVKAKAKAKGKAKAKAKQAAAKLSTRDADKKEESAVAYTTPPRTWELELYRI